MKLLRCYIENYGKLQQFEYDFDDQINIILQENGWGKSTFASFIKAMLFGLPSTRKSDLDENERAKYTPWQKGAFGGWLEFEIKGKQYRIERFFGDKSSKDKTTLYDLETNTTLPDADFVQNQLGINADTFMRSTFIQHGLVSNADDESIRERLGKLIENQEVESVSQVDERLKEYQINIEHLRGSGGKLNTLKKELENTLDSISKCKVAKNTADQLNTEFNQNLAKIQTINKRLSDLRGQLQAVNDERIEIEKRKRLEAMQTELNKHEKEIEEIKHFFHGNPPDTATMNELLETQTNINSFQSALEALNDNSQAQSITKLNEYFKNGVPTEDEIKDVKGICDKLKNIENQMRFSQNVYEKSSALPKPNNPIKYAGFGAIMLGIILLIVGVSAFTNTIALLITFIVAGVIFGGIGTFLVCKPAKNDNIVANITSKTNLENLNQEYERNKNIVENFISKFNENSADYIEAIYNIDTNRKRLIEYTNDTQNTTIRKEELTKKIQKNKAYLTEFYSQYFPNPNNFHACYTDARAKVERLATLTQFCTQKEREMEIFAQENNVNQSKKTIINEESLNEIKRQIDEYEKMREQLTHQNSAVNSQLLTASSQASNLNSLTNYSIELRENIDKLSADLATVKRTREFIAKARDSLTSKYLTPLADAFLEYSRKIVGSSFDKVSIDTNLNVLLEQQGEKKETKFFSHGGRDVIELCMRLALAKTLFDGETPPLIMDDPFCNLDDDKTNRALELMHEIAEEFQVIYLVCHSSRIKKNI
ncbi:MAG: AAA family ATPase [Clostridia bacterium]|nr:AAA family ATPase [Clostridia bacterium]